MHHHKICNKTLSREFTGQKNKINLTATKTSFEKLPFATVKMTTHMLRAIFLLIFFYITVSVFILIFQGGNTQIRNIMVYSISGFFTFFLGYFGWMFARNVIDMISGKKLQQDEL